jgi:DNA/RNA endonuclease YhcR with UshA esterase domain
MNPVITALVAILFNQTPLLYESFTNPTFPPTGWDILRSDTIMGNWYRFNYTGPSGPDSWQARVRVFDASDTSRAGWTTLKTLSLDLADATGQESLFFWYRFSQGAGNLGPDDTMYIDISNDDINWSTLMQIAQGADTNVWQIAHIDLLPYDTYANARIRFHYEDKPNGMISQYNCNLWLDSVQVLNYDTIPETVVLNELLIDPETFDHNNNNDLSDEDEEFIEVFNKAGSVIDVGGYQLHDAIGSNVLNVPAGITIPDSGYLLLYASSELYVFDVNADTQATGLWLGTWPGLDNTGDTIRLYDNVFNEIDDKGYSSSDVLPDFSIARLPNGSYNWVNNAFPTPGQDNGSQFVWSIANAFRDLDSNYVPDLRDSTVTIAGVITAPPGIFSDLEAYIQDHSGGVCLFGDFVVPLNYGDSITATGTVEQYRGKNELADLTYTLLGSGTLPEPIDVDGNILNTEYYEGSLVRVKISYFEGFLLEGNQSYNAWDTLGNQFTVWIDSYTNIPGNYAPNDTFTLTGIKGQYTTSAPPNDGYQLMPRSTDDFSHLFSPTIIDIGEAFRDLDSNYVPDLLNSGVTITGVVTAPPGIFSNDEAYIQDHSGGVCLYGDYPVALDYGDSIIATGQVAQYRGKNELADFTYTLVGPGTLPEPVDVDGILLNTEYYEGSLVRAKISHFDGFLLSGNEPYNAWDTLNNQFTVFIDSYTNIPGSLAPTDTFTLTGIKGQYTNSAPPNDGYQLMPRDTSDFSHFYTPVIIVIGEVQAVGPDGVSSKYVDSVVTVEGVVTGPDYIFTAGNPSFYIQDSTGGINVYNPEGDSLFNLYTDSLGARFRVTGTVTEYNGLTEVANGYAWYLSTDTVPAPRQILPNWFLTEDMESYLVEMTGVITSTAYQTGAGYNFDVLNGDAGITVRFTTESGINPMSIIKNEKKIFTGIVGQYDPDEPYTTGYQLLLRDSADIRVPGYDTISAEPLIDLGGPKTFIPSIGEQAQININSPLDYRLELNIHDMSGRLVRRLYSGAGGPNTLYWEGRDDFARPCKVGIYLLNLKATNSAGKSSHERSLIVIGTQ